MRTAKVWVGRRMCCWPGWVLEVRRLASTRGVFQDRATQRLGSCSLSPLRPLQLSQHTPAYFWLTCRAACGHTGAPSKRRHTHNITYWFPHGSLPKSPMESNRVPWKEEKLHHQVAPSMVGCSAARSVSGPPLPPRSMLKRLNVRAAGGPIPS